MSDPQDCADLAHRLEALSRDRDYWRAQHDVVMADWKADAQDWAEARATLHAAPASAPVRQALLDLLRFFDLATGAVTTRVGEDTLSEAFLRAYRIAAP